MFRLSRRVACACAIAIAGAVLFCACVVRTDAQTCSDMKDTRIAGPPVGRDCGNLAAFDCCARCQARHDKGEDGGCAGTVLDASGCCEYHGSPFGTFGALGYTTISISSPSRAPPSPRPTPPLPPSPGTCSEVPNTGIFGPPIASECGNLRAFDCCARCQGLGGCAGAVANASGCCEYHGSPFGTCAASGSTTIIPASPRPYPPTPSPPTPGPTPENPFGITPLPKRSDNFFLIIGDWGKQDGPGQCQSTVAKMMKDYVAKHQAQGMKVLFVGSVGDNFYATGVKDDDHWRHQWSDVYGTNDDSSPLYGVPWLAVMGNHDLGSADPGCACGKGCKQFNNANRPGGTDKFWIKDYYWYYYIQSIDLEIIGLDTNANDVGGLGGDGCKNGAYETCKMCGGDGPIQSFLDSKKGEGEQFLDQRARTSPAKTVAILQHYDGGLGAQYKARFEGGNGHRAQVLSAYGHAHDQQCQGSRDRGCDVILTGGGAGWAGGAYYGFTAVHLTDDGGFQTVLESNEVRIPQSQCAYTSKNMSGAKQQQEIKVSVLV